jgi:hypothetical protein
MKIWLDDTRAPPTAEWEWFDNAYLVIAALERLGSRITHLHLDHDLGDEEKVGNGYMVLCWLEKQLHTNENFKVPCVDIHTANPVAKKTMLSCLNSMAKVLIRRMK